MAAIVIPARYGSTRFPGKPMHPILGIPMLERVWRIARAVKNCDRIVVATESVEVADFARSFGAEAVITSDRCRNGTERVHEATGVAGIADDIVVNLQGDAVLSPPWVLEAMIEAMMRDAGIEVITPAVQLEGATLAKFADAQGRQQIERNNRRVRSRGQCAVFFEADPALHSNAGVFKRASPRRTVRISQAAAGGILQACAFAAGGNRGPGAVAAARRTA